MTKLARFFRFCGFGIATVSLLIGAAIIVALQSETGDVTPYVIGIIATSTLFVFAVSWITLSFGLEREGKAVDEHYQKALADYERFRLDSLKWYKDNLDDILKT